MIGLLASVGTVIGYLADAIKYGPMVIGFVHNTMTAVEATGQSGPDKLTAVLNAVELFAEELLPSEAKNIEAFMAAVEALVNDSVTVFHDAGVFLHKTVPQG